MVSFLNSSISCLLQLFDFSGTSTKTDVEVKRFSSKRDSAKDSEVRKTDSWQVTCV